MTRDPAPTILWLRQDLRLRDNSALDAACRAGAPVIPVYVLDESVPWAPGGAARWWLGHSLQRLDEALRRCGARLILRRGPAAEVIAGLAAETGAARVLWNRCYEPAAVARDTALEAALRQRGLAVETANAALLFEPWTVRTAAGTPFRVFTPFWRACRVQASARIPTPLPAPGRLPAPARWPDSDRLQDWAAADGSAGLHATWKPGEDAALHRLEAFVDGALARYADARDRPDLDGTSRLSPHLHWGEIGPRQVWHAVQARVAAGALSGRESQAESFLRELAWREFSYHLLYHFPHLPEQPLDPRFAAFPWAAGDGDAALDAWRHGRTGYPIVDAGMRQLWHTGWMHNRVRMIAASFLVKHLLVPWQQGEAWFWDTLADADLASNAASWQWVAGCGADAAPYFRIFNPVLQGTKFDPAGLYVRNWMPELEDLPERWIHRPWEAPRDVLAAAGVRLGETYPAPIVGHDEARKRALAAYGVGRPER